MREKSLCLSEEDEVMTYALGERSQVRRRARALWERRVAHAVEASSSDDIRATLARDPWEPVAPCERVDRPQEDQIDGR